MKKTLTYIAIILAACSCVQVSSDPYVLHKLEVTLQYPDGYESFAREGVKVKVEDVNQGSRYALESDARAVATFNLPDGVYRISASDINGENVFNGSIDKVKLLSDTKVSNEMSYSKAGRIVFKEIYCGGCMKLPEQGEYQIDQYVILHNNFPEVQYLDGLCFSTLAPLNSNSTNPFINQTGTLPSFVPVVWAIWQFPGTGTSFPLQPGEDAVLCLRGAIDHSAQYPLSVNLDKPGYFVCYNNTFFTMTNYHPVPGSNISSDRILDVVIKLGQSKAYGMSINSPAVALFRSPEGKTMSEYVREEGAVIQLPGSTVDKVVCIDPAWVEDAVDVFNGSSTSNQKRFLSTLDAGYVSLSKTYLGHTLYRYTDDEMSALLGYEYLKDTNNSSEDFYEREKQSLHE